MLEQVRGLAADALSPAHFFLAEPLNLELEHTPREEMYWEIFRGRLLDRPQTNRRQAFESLNLYRIEETGRSAEPLLSLKLDATAGQLHVTRAIYSYAWEAYDSGGNVILSRETRKWVRELAGTIPLARFANLDELRDEIICRIFQAVVGSSRLPLTSVESPLPGFSLGQLAYFYRPGLGATERAAGPLRSYRDLLDKALTADLAWIEKAKLLETLLHAVPWEGIAEAADRLMERWRSLPRNIEVLLHNPRSSEVRKTLDERSFMDWRARQDLVALFRTLFNEASLSPYTDLVNKTLVLLRVLEDRQHLTGAEVADFLGYLLRQLGRHLTAYDLITFHHRGANYPDALLLDAALKAYLELAECQPSLFLDGAVDGDYERQQKRIRRRALRQGWLLRRYYEGHLVPDAPTSQGENMRVLPPPHVRVPEEQILYPHRRNKRLYEGDPLERFLGNQASEILRQSIRDLRHPLELRELGMAIFLDRPLDAGKHPLEPDQTLLLSYLAFSRSIALRRLQYLAQDLGLILDQAEYEAYRHSLEADLEVKGISVDAVGATTRSGAVSLADARKVAEDFLFLRNTAQSVSDFERQFFFGPLLERFRLDDLNWSAPVLIVKPRPGDSQAAGRLTLYDYAVRKRLELEFNPELGYESRGGVEFPVGPLRVLRVWEETDDPKQLLERDPGEDVFLPLLRK
jgi:hypothetical protein